jgi:hypothetical protein
MTIKRVLYGVLFKVKSVGVMISGLFFNIQIFANGR